MRIGINYRDRKTKPREEDGVASLVQESSLSLCWWYRLPLTSLNSSLSNMFRGVYKTTAVQQRLLVIHTLCSFALAA